MVDAPTQPRPPEDRAVQIWRLDQFLRWLLPIATFFGVVEVLAAIPTGSQESAITGAIILAYSGIVVVARQLLRRGVLETALRLTWVGILVAAILIVIDQPVLWPPLSMIPFVAVGVALPYTRGDGLIRLLIAAAAAGVGIAAIGVINARPSTVPPLFLSVFNVAATGAVITLVFVLLYQFSSRLTTALDATVSANRSLVATKAELESERERLETTLRSIGDGVVATDRAGAVMFLNPVAERLTGWARAEAIGHPIETVVDLRTETASDSTAFDGAPPRTPIAEDGAQTAWILVDRAGTARPIAHATSPIRGSDGEIHGAVTVFRDISDERRLARQRQELERRTLESEQLERLATLAGGIAQQFNNLLVVIIGNAAIVQEELPAGTDGAAVTAARDIEAAAERAAVLARQMLAFSGRGRFVLTTVDVNAIVRESLEALQTTAAPSVTIRSVLAPALPPLEADENQIRQLLMALLANATEAIGERIGMITIATSRTTIGAVGGIVAGDASQTGGSTEGPIGQDAAAPVIAIDVADTGSGMDEATRRQIFQPFFSTKFVGRGLGLAGASGIVRGHLGRIDVVSEPGAGSTFRVLLPARLETSAPATHPASPAPPGGVANAVSRRP